MPLALAPHSGLRAGTAALPQWREILESYLPGPDIVTKQRVLIANIKLPVGDDRMRPSRFIRAFRLIKPPALHVFLAARFNQNNRPLLGPVINPPICECD